MTFKRPLIAQAALAALALLSLSACGKDQVRPAMIQPVRDPTRLDGAIALLNASHAKKAEKILKGIMKKDPGDREAAYLAKSIVEDPRTLLGAESFDYTVQRDEDFSSLSQRYLGDRMKFYALMRYNDRAAAPLLKAGDQLRIPGTKPKPVAPPPSAPPKEAARPARKAPPPAAPKAAAPPKAATADPGRAAKLRAAGLSALNRGDVARAVTSLRAAAAAAPDDVLIKRDLARAERLYKTVRAKG